MTYNNIKFEEDGVIGILTIARPETLGGTDPGSLEDFAKSLYKGYKGGDLEILLDEFVCDFAEEEFGDIQPKRKYRSYYWY